MKIYIITVLVLLGAVVGTAAARAQTADDYAAAAEQYNQGVALEAQAYEPPDNRYYRGRVVEVLEAGGGDDPFMSEAAQYRQRVRAELTSGPRAGENVTAEYFPGGTGDAAQQLAAGDRVVIVETPQANETAYYVTERYRLPALLWFGIAFVALVIVLSGWKGARSLLGLAFSLAVIIWYILPGILTGHNPFVTFLTGSFLIAVVSLYLGHGFNRRTSIALASTLLTLGLAVGLAVAAVHWTALLGLGSEEAFYLQTGALAGLNLRGLLLGGIIIGVLGLLDDITTAQTAVVEQLYRTDPSLSVYELTRRGLNVGHEHIVSLVNTLALAYVGASFPLLLLFTQGYNPLWTIVNSERIAEEIVRTLIGSSALVLAVPITTYLAARVCWRYGVPRDTSEEQHAHRHG